MQNRSSSRSRERVVDGYPRGRRNRSQNYNLDSYPIDVVDGDGIEDEIGENPTRNTFFDDIVDEYEYESSSSEDFELYERRDSSSEDLDFSTDNYQSESAEDDDSSNESEYLNRQPK